MDKDTSASWAEMPGAIDHALYSARACAGLDMSQVPAGAVRELVEAAKLLDNPLGVCGICKLCGNQLPYYKHKDNCPAVVIQKALAPFVKE